MNQQGRPTQPGEATPIARRTFTGNRALDMEEALIFESGRLDATGVDIDPPEPFADRPAGTDRAGDDPALRPAVAHELFDRRRDLPARLLHDET